MDYSKIALEKHEQWRGKLSIESKARITNKEEEYWFSASGIPP